MTTTPDALSRIVDKAQARRLVDETLTKLHAIALKQANADVAAELRWTIAARTARQTALTPPATT